MNQLTSKMTRKSFLRGLTALAGSSVLLQSGLIPSAVFAQEGEIIRGGIVNFLLNGDPANFDPISGTSSVAMGIISPCYNGLVRYSPQNPEEIIPDLAKSWDVSEDGKLFTFHLIQNAKFHDGVPLTSEDVKYSFDLMRNPPEGTVSARRKLLEVIENIIIVDAYTVTFELRDISPAFLANIASSWLLVMPKHILEKKGNMKEDLVGSGPFKLSKFTRGVSYELVRNPDYHEQGLPYLDGISGYVIPDTGTGWNYLQNGQLQLYYSIQGQDAGVFKTSGDVIVESAPSTSFIAIVYNPKVAPFDNILVRKALSLAADRSVALKVTYNNEGQFGGLSVPGPWSLSSEQLATIPGYGPNGSADLEESKRLLAEAGFPDGFDVKVIVRKNALFEPVGIFVKDQWAKVGVNVTLEVQENAAYIDSINSGKFAATASGGSFAISDPDAIFGDDNLCGGDNDAICGTSLNQIFRRQSTELDQIKRKGLTNELEMAMLAEYGTYVLYWRNRFMGMSTKLMGMKVHPNIDQNMRLDSVWLKT